MAKDISKQVKAIREGAVVDFGEGAWVRVRSINSMEFIQAQDAWLVAYRMKNGIPLDAKLPETTAGMAAFAVAPEALVLDFGGWFDGAAEIPARLPDGSLNTDGAKLIFAAESDALNKCFRKAVDLAKQDEAQVEAALGNSEAP